MDSPKLPLRLDTEALAWDEFVVLDFNYKLVKHCESIEEAEAFIANANGTNIETVHQDAVLQAQMLHQYRENLRRKNLSD